MSHRRVMGWIVPGQNSRKRNFHSDQIYQIQLQMVTILEKMPHFFDWHHLPHKCSDHLHHHHNLKLLTRISLVEHHRLYLLIYVKYHHYKTILIICDLHVHKFPPIRWLKTLNSDRSFNCLSVVHSKSNIIPHDKVCKTTRINSKV